MGNGDGENIASNVLKCPRYGVLDQEECPPQAPEAPVEGTLCEQGREQMPQVFAHIAHDTTLAFQGTPLRHWAARPRQSTSRSRMSTGGPPPAGI